MKNSGVIVFLLLILFGISCRRRQSNDERLVLADSIMQIQPAGALRLLEGMTIREFKTEADKALYALLLTQARDKNYIVQSSDSLIQAVVQYYDRENETLMRAKAHYYWGCVLRDMDNITSAMREFMIALPLAQKSADRRLVGLIYNNIGYQYFNQQQYEQADSIFRLTEKIGIQLQDTNLWGEALVQQGQSKFYRKQFVEAEKLIVRGLEVLGNFKQDDLRASIYITLSMIYGRIGQNEKAIHYARQNIALHTDISYSYWDFLLLGDAYYNVQQYDSATLYINKSLQSSDYETKSDACMRLGDIAKDQGDISRSLEMERLRSKYKDSLRYSVQSNKIHEAKQQLLILQQHTQYQLFLEKHRTYIVAFVIISALLLCISYIWYRKKIYKQRCKQLEVENNLYRLYGQLEDEIKRKSDEIVVLQSEIIQHQAGQEQKEALRKELESLNKQRFVLAQKILKNSDIHAKIRSIIEDCKTKGFSKESLSEDEWLKLLAVLDKKGVVTDLGIQYGFSAREIYLCALSLMGLSVEDKARVLCYKRPTIYRTERSILKKIGEEYEAGRLEKLLRNMMSE